MAQPRDQLGHRVCHFNRLDRVCQSATFWDIETSTCLYLPNKVWCNLHSFTNTQNNVIHLPVLSRAYQVGYKHSPYERCHDRDGLVIGRYEGLWLYHWRMRNGQSGSRVALITNHITALALCDSQSLFADPIEMNEKCRKLISTCRAIARDFS